MPHFAASGCVQATMPLVLWTTLRRLGNGTNGSDPGGKTDGVVNGILSFLFAAREGVGRRVRGCFTAKRGVMGEGQAVRVSGRTQKTQSRKQRWER